MYSVVARIQPLYGPVLTALCAITLIVAASCTGRQRFVDPTGWVSVNGGIDSLTREIEMQFVVGDDDSRLASLLDDYRNMLTDTTDNVTDKELMSRFYFWQGRLLTRQGDEAGKMAQFNAALRIAPPSTADYIRRRIGWLEEVRTDFEADDWYRHLLDEVEFYDNRPDQVMRYARYIELFDLMRSVGLMERAAHYLDLSERAAEAYTRYCYDPGSKLSRSALLFEMGDTLSSAAINRELLDDSVAMLDNQLFALAHYNQFIIAGDTAALHSAYNRLDSTRDYVHLMPKICAYMAGEALDAGQTSTAVGYAERALGLLHLIGQGDDRMVVLSNIARAMEAAGQTDRALAIYKQYALEADSIAKELASGKVAETEQLEEIRRVDNNIRVKNRNQLMLQISVTMLIVLGVATIIYLAMKYLVRRHKASTFTPDIQQLLAQHRLSEIGSDSFQTLFTMQYPDFYVKLRSRAPRISEAALRLAAYIALGLTTKEISEMMNVQPESVKQARWRLRKSLSIPDDCDIKIYLSQLLNS